MAPEERTRKTWYGGATDQQRMTELKERYGISDDSNLIRLLIALVHASPLAQLPSGKDVKGKRKR